MTIKSFCIIVTILVFSKIGFAQGNPDQESSTNLPSQPENIQPASETTAAPNKVLKVQKRTDDLFSMEFRNVDIGDLLRVFAHDYDLNILVDSEIKGKVTASFSNISLEEALSVILENNNLTLTRQGNILKISSNLVSKTFILRFIEAKSLVEIDSANSPESSGSGDSGESRRGDNIHDLLSSDGKLFLGKIPNSILVIDYPQNILYVKNFLNTIDHKMSSRVFKLRYTNVAEILGTNDKADEDSQEDIDGPIEP